MARAARIFVIEDNEEIRDSMAHVFRSEGYFVDTATNGRTALDFLTTVATLPNLIFLDIMMPKMDGLEFRKCQLKDPRLSDIPTVVLTCADLESPDIQMVGASAFLNKPVEVSELLSYAKKYCT